MENVAVQSNPRGDVPDSGGDGDGDGESEGVDKTFIEFAQKLQSIAHLLNDLSDTMPSKVQDKPEVKQCLILVKAMSTCLKELIQFTESPLGQKATNLLWSHLNYFRSLAEIGVGTVIASIFLVVGQDVLDVTKDEFQYAKIKMETRMTNVKKMLNEIQNRVEKAVNLLEDLRKNESDRKSLLDDFDENVRLANLDIQECQRELEYANEDIADIMEKITVKIWLNGALRGGLFVGGGLFVYHLVKEDVISTRFGVMAGLLSLGLILVGLPVPRYRQLQSDFERYQEMQIELSRKLVNLKDKLQDHNRVAQSKFSSTNLANVGDFQG